MKTELQKQKEFLEKLQTQSRLPDIVSGEHFISGMRKLGYRDTGCALDELVDNSIEAGADKLMVLFGFTARSDKKPNELAIVDNGIGMPPRIIQESVVWGGTHRPDSRDFFGRFGFGLPSACMSIGKRFEVYSKQESGDWFMVSIDLEEIVGQDPRYRTPDGRVVPPDPVQQDPPAWVIQDAAKTITLKGDPPATVVVIKKIDNLTYATSDKLQDFLLTHFGTIYRNYLNRTAIFVNEKAVEAIDPLFLDPKARFFDVGNGKFAEALPELRIPIQYERAANRGTSEVVVRFSYLPYGFMRFGGEENDARKGGMHKGRQAVMDQNLGIVFLRQGRQIEVITSRCPWTKFQTNDRNVRIEVDFPSVLDEHFEVPTNKQQVVPTEHIWALLQQHGVRDALKSMRDRYTLQHLEAKAKREQDAHGEAAKPAEEAMTEVDRLIPRKPLSPKRQQESESLLDERAKKRAVETGETVDKAREEVQKEAETRKYRVVLESNPEGPFYTCRHPGGSVELVINSAHRFYTDVYASPHGNEWTRACLESLLFVMSVRELEVGEELEEIYRNERNVWSNTFARVLKALESRFDNSVDQRNFEEQMEEDAELETA
jgi:hypothetical protein